MDNNGEKKELYDVILDYVLLFVLCIVCVGSILGVALLGGIADSASLCLSATAGTSLATIAAVVHARIIRRD